MTRRIKKCVQHNLCLFKCSIGSYFFSLHFPTFSAGQFFPGTLPCEEKKRRCFAKREKEDALQREKKKMLCKERNGRCLASPKRLLHEGPQLIPVLVRITATKSYSRIMFAAHVFWWKCRR